MPPPPTPTPIPPSSRSSSVISEWHPTPPPSSRDLIFVEEKEQSSNRGTAERSNPISRGVIDKTPQLQLVLVPCCLENRDIYGGVSVVDKTGWKQAFWKAVQTSFSARSGLLECPARNTIRDIMDISYLDNNIKYIYLEV
jgi:hypothetical protein